MRSKNNLGQLENEKQNLVSQRDAAVEMLRQLVEWSDHKDELDDPCWAEARNFLTDDNPSVANDGDFGLTVKQLRDKYGPYGHPHYIGEDWLDDVSNGDTVLGYWEWVLHNVESHYGDACEHCGKSQCDKVYVPDLGMVCRKCAADHEDT